jgi:hypothetical protein
MRSALADKEPPGSSQRASHITVFLRHKRKRPRHVELAPWDNVLVPRYEDPGVEEVMRESGERFEQILREMRTDLNEFRKSRAKNRKCAASPDEWPTRHDLLARLEEFENWRRKS